MPSAPERALPADPAEPARLPAAGFDRIAGDGCDDGGVDGAVAVAAAVAGGEVADGDVADGDVADGGLADADVSDGDDGVAEAADADDDGDDDADGAADPVVGGVMLGATSTAAGSTIAAAGPPSSRRSAITPPVTSAAITASAASFAIGHVRRTTGAATRRAVIASAIVRGRSSGCFASIARTAASNCAPSAGNTEDGAGTGAWTCIIIVANGDSPSKGRTPARSSNATTPNE